jgi:hypothetical protein
MKEDIDLIPDRRKESDGTIAADQNAGVGTIATESASDRESSREEDLDNKSESERKRDSQGFDVSTMRLESGKLETEIFPVIEILDGNSDKETTIKEDCENNKSEKMLADPANPSEGKM